jgi:DNA-binding transcriptional LysR family regulator
MNPELQSTTKASGMDSSKAPDYALFEHDRTEIRSQSVIIRSEAMDLDIGHVRSFLAVVDYGGYHRAAEALHLTQPAVSQHVRRLEQRVGGPLFERRGRGVQVSARGEAVAQELRDLLRVNDRAVARLAGAERPFVLGAVEHFVDPLLPRLLRMIGRPVQLRVDRSRHLVDALAAGEVDAVIVIDPGHHPAPELVGEIELSWYAGTDADVIEPLGLVAYTAPCALRNLALRRLDSLGLETYVAAESTHLSGIHTAVRNGLGVAPLAAGADGLRRIEDGPLAQPMNTRLWLAATVEQPEIAEALRSGLRSAAPTA